jgi:putative NADH-flavin reductase
MRLALLGASGRVGRQIIEEAMSRGFEVAAQTRDANKLEALADFVDIHVFDPVDSEKLSEFVRNADTVVMALGVKSRAPTTVFSDVTKVLLDVMNKQDIARLIAITGVGAGETRGHGGIVYDGFIYPLFTRNRYRDKEYQERLIQASGLDWTIVRPAPFSKKRFRNEPEVHTAIRPEVVLKHITTKEVAKFVVEQFQSDRYLHQKPFIGHP